MEIQDRPEMDENQDYLIRSKMLYIIHVTHAMSYLVQVTDNVCQMDLGVINYLNVHVGIFLSPCYNQLPQCTRRCLFIPMLQPYPHVTTDSRE